MQAPSLGPNSVSSFRCPSVRMVKWLFEKMKTFYFRTHSHKNPSFVPTGNARLKKGFCMPSDGKYHDAAIDKLHAIRGGDLGPRTAFRGPNALYDAPRHEARLPTAQRPRLIGQPLSVRRACCRSTACRGVPIDFSSIPICKPLFEHFHNAGLPFA
jgi:hypothetical protein